MNKLLICAALERWIGGEVVAKHTIERMGVVIAVVQRADGTFDMLRAFQIGTGADVSADIQGGTAVDVMQRLLAVMA